MAKRPRHYKDHKWMLNLGGQLVPATVRQWTDPDPPEGIRQPEEWIAYGPVGEPASLTCAECGHHTRHVQIEYYGACSYDDLHYIMVCTRCAGVDASALPHACEMLDYMRWVMGRELAEGRLKRPSRPPRCQT